MYFSLLFICICTLIVTTELYANEVISDRKEVEIMYLKHVDIRNQTQDSYDISDPVCNGSIEQKRSICEQVIKSKSKKSLIFVGNEDVEKKGWMCEKKFVRVKVTNEVVEDNMLGCYVSLKANEKANKAWPYYITISKLYSATKTKIEVFGFLKNKTDSDQRVYNVEKYYKNITVIESSKVETDLDYIINNVLKDKNNLNSLGNIVNNRTNLDNRKSKVNKCYKNFKVMRFSNETDPDCGSENVKKYYKQVKKFSKNQTDPYYGSENIRKYSKNIDYFDSSRNLTNSKSELSNENNDVLE